MCHGQNHGRRTALGPPQTIDCPVDPNNPTSMRCFGFSFKMPGSWKAPDKPIVPDDNLFVNGATISPNDACVYSPVPNQP